MKTRGGTACEDPRREVMQEDRRDNGLSLKVGELHAPCSPKNSTQAASRKPQAANALDGTPILFYCWRSTDGSRLNPTQRLCKTIGRYGECNGVAFKMTRSCRTGPEDCDAEVGARAQMCRGADQKQ